MKSFGSLSVNAIKLWRTSALQHLKWFDEYVRQNSLNRRLRHRYSPPVQVLLQPLIQLCKPSKLQLGHRLLLAFAGIVLADLVRRRHCALRPVLSLPRVGMWKGR